MMDAKSTSTSMHNWIVLCESIFGLTPFFLIEGGSKHLKWIKKIFTIPPDNTNDEALQRYPLNYDFNMLII